MKKFLVVLCSAVLAFGLAGCWGKGKAPVGKGKAPVVQTLWLSFRRGLLLGVGICADLLRPVRPQS